MAEKVLREAINIDPTAFEAWWAFVVICQFLWLFVHINNIIISQLVRSLWLVNFVDCNLL